VTGAVRLWALSKQNPFDVVRVVLVGARNPLNIGAAARAMSNFGFSHLRVVNTYEVAFREARSAVGAADVLLQAKEFATVGEAVADCSLVIGTTAAGRRELQHPLRRLKEGAAIVRKRMKSGNVGILFGSEKIGLTNEAISHCDWLMRIPSREEHRSINLGQAVAICLYEVGRDGGVALKGGRLPGKVATTADIERVTAVLMEALQGSGSLKTRSAESTERKVRRMFRRHGLTTADAEFWLGMLRQIVWRMEIGKDSKG
jgi:TrmH family RNA methyltransferase